MSAGMTPVVGGDAGDPSAAVFDPDDLRRTSEHRTAGLRASTQRHDGARRLGQAVGLDVEPAENALLVEEGVQLGALLGFDHPCVDAPRGRPPLPAMQLGQPLRGGRDLQTADLVEAPLPVDVEGLELLDRVARQRGHGLGRCGLEDEAGGVGRGSAGQRQRSLVDDGDVVPSSRSQFVGEIGADDAGTDDHDAG